MRRAYNEKLSPSINAQLARRAHVIALQKRLIAFFAILIVSLMILLGTSMKTFASANKEQLPVQKYYTSIQVESGDTVWEIAERYTADYDVDMQEYIDEVCAMNQLQNGQIHSGQHIVVAYYSTEVK